MTWGTIAYRGGTPMIHAPFMESWWRMMDTLRQENYKDVHFMVSHQPYRHTAIMELVDGFEGDWLLNLDTDHVFEPETVISLIGEFESKKLDVLSGFYQYRVPPYDPVAYTWNEKENRYDCLNPCPSRFNTDLVPLDAGGLGCLVIRRHVLEHLRSYYDCNPFSPLMENGILWGEDMSFFIRCHKQGIKCWLAPWLEFRHLTVMPVTRDLIPVKRAAQSPLGRPLKDLE
jgi:hypothetical protein